MLTELTSTQLTNLIRHWVENNTDYQKRLKPIMTLEQCRALAEYISGNYDSVIVHYPPSVTCIVPVPCPHNRIEATQDLHQIKCLDCGREWCDVQG